MGDLPGRTPEMRADIELAKEEEPDWTQLPQPEETDPSYLKWLQANFNALQGRQTTLELNEETLKKEVKRLEDSCQEAEQAKLSKSSFKRTYDDLSSSSSSSDDVSSSSDSSHASQQIEGKESSRRILLE
jgi:hypothetical protein